MDVDNVEAVIVGAVVVVVVVVVGGDSLYLHKKCSFCGMVMTPVPNPAVRYPLPALPWLDVQAGPLQHRVLVCLNIF